MVTVKGVLDAAERRDGAIKDGDYNWAVVHDSVLRIAKSALAEDLRSLAAATGAYSRMIRRTDADLTLPVDPTDTYHTWFGSKTGIGRTRKALLDAGLSKTEASRAIAWFESGQPLTIWGAGHESTVLVSEYFHQAADDLYSLASRFDEGRAR